MRQISDASDASDAIFSTLSIVKRPIETILEDNYHVFTAAPATGILYIINDFLSGHVRLRGKSGGSYPYLYLEMINEIFGKEDKTIEVCSGNVSEAHLTVDIKQAPCVSMIADGQDLKGISDNTFGRWRCDPPYNEVTAKEMYNCKLPSLSKLLQEGARVVKPSSLMFLLCSQNYQICPANVKRIGLIIISVVPNNELRVLNIYLKLPLEETDGYGKLRRSNLDELFWSK